MSRLFSNIFLPERATYTYDTSRDSVRLKIAEILSKSGGLFTEPDIHGGFFDDYSFYMVAQPAVFTFGDSLFYTVLYGTIKETEFGQTVVETKTVISILFKFVFVFVLAIGVACFYNSYRQTSPLFFFLGVGACFLVPFTVNWIAGLSKEIIKDRYERYIHKATKVMTSA